VSEPYLAELRIVAFNFAPKGWAFCNGQVLPINQNQALFSLLGTTYGGNGFTTFALPNLQGTTAMHTSAVHPQGEFDGEANHQLTISEMPAHTHTVHAGSAAATVVSPSNAAWANSSPQSVYSAAANTTMLNAAIGTAGGSQPHNNVPPYLVLSVIIALVGIFPARS
jgi:microcystin-dependent protein